MNYELKLAWKYFRARKRSLARFTSFIAIIGIAFGMGALIIANSLAGGFQDEIQDKILANTSHITIFKKDNSEIKNYREIIAQFGGIEGIKEISGSTYQDALLSSESASSYVVLRAFESEPGGDQEISVKIGSALAEKTGLLTGDTADLMIASGGEAKDSKVKIGGDFRTGLYDYDSTWIYLSFADLARIQGRPASYPTLLNIKTADIYRVREISGLIGRALGDEYKVLDWQEANQPLFQALSLEKRVVFIVILLITLVAVLNITTTLSLLVEERRFDIAILRTCGAKTNSLIKIFLLEGIILGMIGIFCGVIFGALSCFLINYFNLISLNTEIYSIGSIYLRIDAIELLIIAFITFLLCIAATVVPAWKASKIKPMDNLRV